jgi:hypothetical protein
MKKLIERKNKFIKEVAQELANSLVIAVEIIIENNLPEHHLEMIIFYSLMLDNYMIETHGVYLD